MESKRAWTEWARNRERQCEILYGEHNVSLILERWFTMQSCAIRKLKCFFPTWIPNLFMSHFRRIYSDIFSFLILFKLKTISHKDICWKLFRPLLCLCQFFFLSFLKNVVCFCMDEIPLSQSIYYFIYIFFCQFYRLFSVCNKLFVEQLFEIFNIYDFVKKNNVQKKVERFKFMDVSFFFSLNLI